MGKSPVVVMCAFAAVLSASALADDRLDCLEQPDDNLAIQGCTELIGRDPKNAIAHYKRGAAYARRGDPDRAIADYTKAIELNPTYGAAYNSRGLAYVSKGDYTRAVADVTKAGEFAAKGRLQARRARAGAGKPKASSASSPKGGAKDSKAAEAGAKF